MHGCGVIIVQDIGSFAHQSKTERLFLKPPSSVSSDRSASLRREVSIMSACRRIRSASDPRGCCEAARCVRTLSEARHMTYFLIC